MRKLKNQANISMMSSLSAIQSFLRLRMKWDCACLQLSKTFVLAVITWHFTCLHFSWLAFNRAIYLYRIRSCFDQLPDHKCSISVSSPPSFFRAQRLIRFSLFLLREKKSRRCQKFWIYVLLSKCPLYIFFSFYFPNKSYF